MSTHCSSRYGSACSKIPTLFFIAASFTQVTASGQDTTLEDVLAEVPDSLSSDRDKVARTVKTFRAREKTLFNRFGQELDQLAAQIKNDKTITDVQRTIFDGQIDRTRNWLQTGSSLGGFDVTGNMIIDAAAKARKLRTPVERAARSLSKKLRAKDENVADKFDRAVFLLGGVFNGHTTLAPGMVFEGHRAPAGDTQKASMRFTFGKKDGDLSFSKVETGMQYIGHPHHALNWQIDGLTFRATTGESVRPDNRMDSQLKYDGVIIGDVIFGSYSGKNNRGQSVKGSFRVMKK